MKILTFVALTVIGITAVNGFQDFDDVRGKPVKYPLPRCQYLK